MLLKQLINKSVYGTIGYISSQEDLDLLEQYILYNLQVLKEYKQIIIATNYKNYPELAKENTQLWRKYFSNSITIDSFINRGHNLGTADLDNLIFNYCKNNNIEWLCKSANDIIINLNILNKEIYEADFYYTNGLGYASVKDYDFDFNRVISEYLINQFYPQTNFYFLNVSKTDYLNNEYHINEVYEKLSNLGGSVWDYEFKSCEGLLRDCVERNNLSKFNLLPINKFPELINAILIYKIHDGSHKNLLIENICHYHYPNQPIIEI